MNSQQMFLIIFVSIIVLVLAFVLLLNFLRGKYQEESKAYRAHYPSSYLCKDGDKVRSLSELVVDDFFYLHRIPHTYEDVILKTSEKKYKYDWYFPEADIYVEFFGFSGKKYKDTQRDKINFYRKHNLNMVALDPSDLDDLSTKIPAKFGKHWDHLIHSRHCPHCGDALDNRV
ncbi:hypothetical protein [Candidatus Lokiarchaeum ossiferum]|uniref:hypothetical protein n=1 Tax=Candidatus Lokiarchaeum ossiferum TaxID=2951803 RepID=UPI00352BE0E7